MLKLLSRKIALQFTALVFILLIIVGILFLFADFYRLRQATNQQLSAQTTRVLSRINHPIPTLDALGFSKRDLIFTRLISISGKPLYTGEFFVEVTSNLLPPNGTSYSNISYQNKEYRILTTPLFQQAKPYGYLQVATEDVANIPDLIRKSLVYSIVCCGLSLLTYLLGLQFAKRTMKPVQESMERLSQFTQDASHELKTPLTVLLTTLDLALKTKNYEEGIISAKKDVTDATILVEKLLELAQLDTVHLRKDTINISDLTNDIIQKYSESARKNTITFEKHIPPQLCISGDEALIRQLISNLLQNAIKFNNPGGVIKVVLTKQTLSVKDSGIGISENDKATVFDRFFQADSSRSHDGFGLGLAIARKITDLHKWHIKLQSTLGEGSTFTIIFPTIQS